MGDYGGVLSFRVRGGDGILFEGGGDFGLSNVVEDLVLSSN